ncbi:MAG: hypothetical protein M5R40_23025 [Anaerolineae bacterium]|nr:hypothetical protein [Anaerolineae bacterium]
MSRVTQTVLTIFALGVALAATAPPAAAQEPGVNLLVNPSMEGAYGTWGGIPRCRCPRMGAVVVRIPPQRGLAEPAPGVQRDHDLGRLLEPGARGRKRRCVTSRDGAPSPPARGRPSAGSRPACCLS